MKKLYIKPQTDVCEMLPAQIMATSGVTGSGGGVDLGYGGVDEGGEQDPDVKGNSFEFEW
ncbi:MAG: hypothetical protein IJ209_03270 [Bacteroidaceae bacterium]|nr:hypothetical protein [Bacteroidaceae bacterium]